MSGKRGDPKGKYFRSIRIMMAGLFADKQLGYRERKQALSNLIQTYLATFADIGVETWLMHGTLLGWWWNRKILPWDSDSDVQVSEASMHYLASYYNMSVFHYRTPRIPEGRDYMLEVNPHYVNREQTDKLNVIDARWVDTTSGLFIDITTARYNYTHPAGEGMLSCKDGHEYRDTYIFPLRDTFFEGAPAKIPFAYKELLEAEYKQKALTLTDFEGHHFDEEKLEWIPVPKKLDPKKEAARIKLEEEKAKKEEEKKKQEEEEKAKQEAAKQATIAKATEDIKRAEEQKKLLPAPVPVPLTKGETANAPPNTPDTRVEPPISKQPTTSPADEKIEAALKTAEEKRKVAEAKAAQAEEKRTAEAEKVKKSSP
ncbi:hypothetical protein L207DRAFT_431451 [Hyaloscypha variabilis F]|uniref:LicD/FKTN/FKRP nucleotidyltransferase domain-containing protein n=1 Tax=Hyaloscypha variabilis (strain UAMH 11265 / GT02V1 / F) TaxID=1149755 RepID=A0A2J6RJ11_HYAVF|nr:hypothetical protein L207DRAFT_431451 [Hyaloscypha variabilis F]